MLLKQDGFQGKTNMKPPAMSPPRKDTIPNQDSTGIITQQDLILPQIVAKWSTGYKRFNDTHFQIKQKKNIMIL